MGKMHLSNPVSCAPLISFPVYVWVALLLVTTQSESVNKNSCFLKHSCGSQMAEIQGQHKHKM